VASSLDYLIVGLGNPGAQYSHTRHNLGFMVMDRCTAKRRVRFRRSGRFLSSSARMVFRSQDVLFVKPDTFMNRSGMAVSKLIKEKKLSLSRLLVVCDDFNIPLGKIRIRQKGSDGGHNGLASIIDEVGSNAFPRLRMGIGSQSDIEAADYVLSPFLSEEMLDVDEMVERSCQAIFDFMIHDLTWMMNHYNS